MSKRNEIWKDVIGYEGLYKVSNFGNVISLNRCITRSDGRVANICGRTMSQRPTSTCDYLVVDLCKGGKRKHFLTHILVARAFVDGYAQGLEINHIDGNKRNNCANNLEYVTRQGNIDHSILNGLKNDYGENHVHAKLTNKQAEQIRLRNKMGEKQVDLAKEFHVCKQTICSIVNYKTYTK